MRVRIMRRYFQTRVLYVHCARKQALRCKHKHVRMHAYVAPPVSLNRHKGVAQQRLSRGPRARVALQAQLHKIRGLGRQALWHGGQLGAACDFKNRLDLQGWCACACVCCR